MLTQHFLKVIGGGAAGVALIAGVSAAAAQTRSLAALQGDNSIAIVDSASGKVTATWRIDGFSGDLVGIDLRPADGQLYALGGDGSVFVIDPATGKSMMKSKLEMAPPSGASVDFNPVADRLRIIGKDGTNLRVNVDDGKVTKDGQLRYADGDTARGKTPMVIAAAYTNSTKGAKETTLFNIDSGIGAVVRQAPPNDGVLNTIGMHGAKGDVAAFDIVSDANGGNEGWLLAGDRLHRVDLATGKASEALALTGLKGVKDIAALPAM